MSDDDRATDDGSTDNRATDEQIREAVGERLKEAFAALGAAEVPAEDKPRWHQRLIAITNSSKHDLATAQRRLDKWFADLADASGAGAPGAEA